MYARLLRLAAPDDRLSLSWRVEGLFQVGAHEPGRRWQWDRFKAIPGLCQPSSARHEG